MEKIHYLLPTYKLQTFLSLLSSKIPDSGVGKDQPYVEWLFCDLTILHGSTRSVHLAVFTTTINFNIHLSHIKFSYFKSTLKLFIIFSIYTLRWVLFWNRKVLFVSILKSQYIDLSEKKLGRSFIFLILYLLVRITFRIELLNLFSNYE